MKLKLLDKKPAWLKIPKKIRKGRKTDTCLNCGTALNEDFNYCPSCGQENEDHHVSFSRLTHDFFSNYFSYDSKLGRTIVPFFFKPGFLTNEFIAGKRASYLHPVRMYLFTSFVYFFVFSFYFGSNVRIDKSVNKKFGEITLSDESEAEPSDSIRIAELDSIQTSPNDAFGERLTNLFTAAKLAELTEDQLIDTLHYEPTFTNRLLARQSNRIKDLTPSQFMDFVWGKIPVLMFIVLPVFAFFLFLFYIRRSRYYIEHLIFTLHIHSFGFFWFGLILLEEMIYSSNIVAWLSVLVITLYCYFSFRRVYKQSRLKTIVKMFSLGWIYFFLLLFGFILWILLSLIII